jgi:Mrp family chromosome partitioning ATPase
MYIQLKIAADKTGLTEEELMSLALNSMLQFYYPDAEQSWQPVPEEKVREVYVTQCNRPNSAMMDPEEYRNFVHGRLKMWFKEMFFLQDEDISKIMSHDFYGYIKKYAAKPQQPERRKKNVFKAIGAAVLALDLRKESGGNESHEAKNASSTATKSYEGRSDGSSVRKQKPSAPPTPSLRQRIFNRHKPVLWMADPKRHSRIVDAFRSLVNKISFVSYSSKKKVFLMTGSDSKVGTSTILFNTGLMMGRILDRKILIVDANIYHPSLQIAFDASSAFCLTDYLLAGATLSDIVQPTFLPNLDIITCKRTDDKLLSPFSKPAFFTFFQEIREQYEIILLDSAPALQSSHTNMLLPEADGVIIVAEAGESRMRVLEELVRHLHIEGATILGSFLNKRRYPVPKWIYQVM